MAGFIEGIDRGQSTLFPERLEDWVGEDHLVRVVDLFVEELDSVRKLGFDRTYAGADGASLATTRRSCSSSSSTAT